MVLLCRSLVCFFFKQKPAYEMRLSDWSSDVCSSDLEAIAEPFGDHFLQRFEFGIDEFDHLARLDINQMVVMRLRRRFIARAAVAEIVAVEDARLFEQAAGAIDGGDGDAAVEQIGRAHVCTPVTNANLVCRLLLYQ